MSQWNTIGEMVAQLRLGSASSDLEAIRAELKREMASLHPDRNGGSFKSDAVKDRYHALTEGLSFVDQQSSSAALIPIRDIPGIVAAMKQALQPTVQESALAARTEYRQLALGEAHSRYTLPRIGSGAFAAICAGLLTFSGALKDNPVFGSWFESPAARMSLLAVFFYSGVFFVMTWLLEQREAARVEWLATEAGLRRTMSRVMEMARDRSGGHLRFSFSDFCHALSDPRFYYRRPSSAALYAVSSLFLLRRGLSASSAERLAKLHLDELERRGVIRKLDAKRLDITYECDGDIAEDLRRRHAEW